MVCAAACTRVFDPPHVPPNPARVPCSTQMREPPLAPRCTQAAMELEAEAERRCAGANCILLSGESPACRLYEGPLAPPLDSHKETISLWQAQARAHLGLRGRAGGRGERPRVIVVRFFAAPCTSVRHQGGSMLVGGYWVGWHRMHLATTRR